MFGLHGFQPSLLLTILLFLSTQISSPIIRDLYYFSIYYNLKTIISIL